MSSCVSMGKASRWFLPVFVLCIIATVQNQFPHWRSTWPTVTDLQKPFVAVAGWFSNESGTNGLVIYRVFLSETNVFIPETADMAIVELATNRFTGWVHIPSRWNNPHWRADANKGVWVQKWGDDQAHWIGPNETASLPAFAFRLSGEGTVTLRGWK